MTQIISRFFTRWCAQLKLIELWLLIVSSVLISSGMTYYVIAADFNVRAIDVRTSADKRVTELESINKELVRILEYRLNPLTKQYDELSELYQSIDESQNKVLDKIEDQNKVLDKSKRAAVKASKAAEQASTAADYVRKNLPMQPLNPIKKTPTTGVKCMAGRDVYGDRCE